MTRRRKWILTGGAGFIGSNAARSLAERGFEVVLLDNLSRPSAPLNLQWLREGPGEISFSQVDIRDRAGLGAAFAEHGDAEAVVHLAAQVAVTTSIEDPVADFDTNALGTLNVLEATRAHVPGAAFLNVSSNKVYGGLEDHRIEEAAERYVHADLPDGISEAQPLDPSSPYGCSKAAGDVYALDYAKTYGLRALSLRQSCIYGPRQFGIEDQGWVAWFAIAALLDRKLTVYGTGKQVRDLLHVDDLVELYVRAVDRADELSGRAYNIGGGPANTLSLLELLRLLEQRHGREIPFTNAPARTADQKIFVCDISRARAELGWEPQIGVGEGIEQLLDWVGGHADAAARLLATA